MIQENNFALHTIDTPRGPAVYYRLAAVECEFGTRLERLPFSVRVLLENLLRHLDSESVSQEEVRAVANWPAQAGSSPELAFRPARVLLQDFTGVPVVVDLAAMRSALARAGADPEAVNPELAVDLVVDHSVQVDRHASPDALAFNMAREYERNSERYSLLRWAQQAFDNFRVVPPGKGIIHQVNLERLAPVVQLRERGGQLTAFPDTVLGTDSHTVTINGLGVVGWGVGGIEAEAAMLGRPYYIPLPEVVGVKLTGKLNPSATATDLALTATRVLREHGVVNKFVEFFGPGIDELSVPDRATLANMAPEYGATMGFFPVDERTLSYLRTTGRPESHVDFVEEYCRRQLLFRTTTAASPAFSSVVELDLSSVERCAAGPRLPYQQLALHEVPDTIEGPSEGEKKGPGAGVDDGSVVIAAVTSCTNTSNPSLMVKAGLLARNAVEAGLEVKPWVKTSLAPGSRTVTAYLQELGLLPYLEQLGYHVVGYGCTTCIGNSGPLAQAVVERIAEEQLEVAAVVSGNRNFEGRVSPLAAATYLASPPLVVAYALAGTVNTDLSSEPLGTTSSGKSVYLRDIWPDETEAAAAVERVLCPELFRASYAEVWKGGECWSTLEADGGALFDWEATSTYIQEPPFFVGLTPEAGKPRDIHGARVLLLLGDNVTTDHISPAGSIPEEGPAAEYLRSRGVSPDQFNTFGARRGNHKVMVRGGFSNDNLRNRLVPGSVGGVTRHLPTGDKLPVYEAAQRYAEAGTPLLIIAGKNYGVGSSRDWAAKAVSLLGVRAVIAESYERIHRSNLVGMGVLPLQFIGGQNAAALGLEGTETYHIVRLNEQLEPGGRITVMAERQQGGSLEFEAAVQLNTAEEVHQYRSGGLLQAVLRPLMS